MNFQPATVGPEAQDLNSNKTVRRVIQAAQNMCKEQSNKNISPNCKFFITYDARSNSAANAKSELDPQGNTKITINAAMVNTWDNADEIAFVVAHEVAHTLADHHATLGTRNFTGGFTVTKKSQPTMELEADALATVLSHNSGFDPLRGSEILRRVGHHAGVTSNSHPPLLHRLKIVQRTYAKLMQGFEIELN